MQEEKKLDFVKRIEDMTDMQLKERIQYSMDYEIKNKIRPVPYLGGQKLFVEYSYPELQARCPMTGIKDLYKVRIKYIPDKFIPELKSLKFYFFGYEELPISHEHIAAKVHKDFLKALSPISLAIQVYVATRGELDTTIALGDANLLSFTREEREDNYAK